MVDINGRGRIGEEFKELEAKYSRLKLFSKRESWNIAGSLVFRAEYEGQELEDEYSIEINVPHTYPNSLPSTKEVGGRIPLDYHRYLNESLCLGTLLAVKKKFLEKPTLLGYVDNCIVPYLYAYTYLEEYDRLPYGELAHGGEGILEYYRSLFGTKDNAIIVSLIQLLAEEGYRGHIPCPCGSEKRLRACHGPDLREIRKMLAPKSFQLELEMVRDYLKAEIVKKYGLN